MPTNATLSVIVGYLTLLADGAVELFNWHLSGQQQHALVGIIGAAAGLAAIAYGALVHHAAAGVVKTKLLADARTPVLTTSSGVLTTSSGAGTTYTVAVPAAPAPARKRPSRAKPKTPPAS